MENKVTLTGLGSLTDSIPEKNWKFAESIESHMAIAVAINLETYFELRYLLKFACENLDNYKHIENAVNLIQDIENYWKERREYHESENEEDE